jgi:hypothetical protein
VASAGAATASVGVALAATAVLAVVTVVAIGSQDLSDYCSRQLVGRRACRAALVSDVSQTTTLR